MAELLLLNPRARRRRKSPARKRARRRNPIAGTGLARRARRRNPIAGLARRRMRRNPIAGVARLSRRRARRRNPIGGGARRLSVSGVTQMLMQAAVGGAGAVAVDFAWSKLNPKLPATLQTGRGLGVGDAVKALVTAVAGLGLSRVTRGLSAKAAAGALTVQIRDVVLKGMLQSGVAGLSYYSPASIVRGQARVGPNAAMQTGGAVGAYVRPGSQTPLLSGASGYLAPGSTALLSGRMPAASRERVSNWR